MVERDVSGWTAPDRVRCVTTLGQFQRPADRSTTTSCSRSVAVVLIHVQPVGELDARLSRPHLRRIVVSKCRKAIASHAGPSSTRTSSFRWRSPSTRTVRTSKWPSNSGSGNACPQGPASRSRRAMSSVDLLAGATHRRSGRRRSCRRSSSSGPLPRRTRRETLQSRRRQRQTRRHRVTAESCRSDPDGGWRPRPAHRGYARPAPNAPSL